MRRLPLVLLGIALLATACEDYSEHVVRGTLFIDSTKTTPMAGDTLVFYESEDYSERDAKYLGYAVSDDQGHWGFMYVRNFDNPYMQQPAGAKLSLPQYRLLITCGNDTLSWDYVDRGNSDEGYLDLWPGCWHRPDGGYPPADSVDIDTTTVDTLSRKGGWL